MDSREELLHYIRRELEHGASKETLVKYLKVGGWPERGAEAAIAEVEKTKKDGVYAPVAEIIYPEKENLHRIRKGITIAFLIIVILLIYFYIVGGTN